MVNFIFEKESLQEIAAQLERWYGMHFFFVSESWNRKIYRSGSEKLYDRTNSIYNRKDDECEILGWGADCGGELKKENRYLLVTDTGELK